MINYPRKYIHENFYVGDTKFVTCLHHDPERKGGCWHVTECGKLYRLEYVVGRYRVATSWDNEPTFLENVEDAAEYVREQTKELEKISIPFALDQMMPTVGLAIYPGYFSDEESVEQRSMLLDAFRIGLGEMNKPSANRNMARYIHFFSTRGVSSYTKSALTYMPSAYVGMMVAHGLVHKIYWGSRHEEALLEGWRYQLLHPDEPYADPELDPKPDFVSCLIERDLKRETREELLVATSLTEEDVGFAKGMADLAGTDQQSRTKIILRHLATRSNVVTPMEPIGAELPSVIGTDYTGC